MNYQTFYKNRSQRSEVASIISPNPGIRGEMALRGQTPKDHAKDNYRKMKELEDQAQRKREEDDISEALKENKWKMNKFKHVESKVKVPKGGAKSDMRATGGLTKEVLAEKNSRTGMRQSGSNFAKKPINSTTTFKKPNQAAVTKAQKLAAQMESHPLKIVTYDPETGEAQEETTDFIKANVAQYNDQMTLNEKMDLLRLNNEEEEGHHVDDNDVGSITTAHDYADAEEMQMKQKKPTVPRANERNHLAPRKDRNFVNSNLKEMGEMKAKNVVEDEAKTYGEVKEKHTNYGKLPKYLENYNKKAAAEKDRLRTEEEQKDIPAGTRLLGADEVATTLGNLKQSRQELFLALEKLPIANVTRAVENRKKHLEEKIKEVDRALDLFSRPKVYVQLDA